jgi:hypothetical protein
VVVILESAMDSNDQPILNYATPIPEHKFRHIAAMRKWRSYSGWSVCIIIAGFLLYSPLGAGALICLVVTSIMTLGFMTLAARSEVGTAYALRQLTLAVILVPALLIGVFVIPLLVESDLIKWRHGEERTQPPIGLPPE